MHRLKQVFLLLIILTITFCSTDYLTELAGLISYNRLFTSPERGVLNQVDKTTGTTSTFTVGAAKVSILSTLGNSKDTLPLSGFGTRKSLNEESIASEIDSPGAAPHNHYYKSNEGTLDDLNARVIYINSGASFIYIVSLDAIATTQDLYDSIFAKMKTDNLVTARNQLIVSSTHTHSGIGGYATRPFWKLATMDIYVPAAMDALIASAVSAATSAKSSSQSADIGIATIAIDSIQRNRRSQYYASGAAPLNKSATIMQFRKTGTTTVISTLTNYPIHFVAAGASNAKYSADVGDSFYTAVETAYAGSVALFINGAEGDVSTNGDASTIGTTIATKTQEAVNSMSFASSGKINSASYYLALPSASVTIQSIESAVASSNTFSGMLEDDISQYILSAFADTAIALGDNVETDAYFAALYLEIGTTTSVMLTTIPGEAITDIGTSLISTMTSKQTMATKHTMIAGLSNGHIGYIVTAAQYDKGGYEATATLYGRDTDTYLTNAINSILVQVSP